MFPNSRFDLTGQSVIITGGGKGIGKVYAREFARAGARVVAADIDGDAARDVAAVIVSEGGTCLGVTTDVSDAASVEAMVAATLGAFGRIDVLINNASLMSTLPRRSFLEIPEEEWDRVMSVNLKGLFLCCRSVVPHMRDQGRGKIVNISSSRVWEGVPNRLHYTTSKAGVIGFTKSLGKELAGKGVLVNCITPATFESPILAQLPQSQVDYMRSKIPMGRLGEASETAALACWLASEECSFSTAATFDTSGGRTTY